MGTLTTYLSLFKPATSDLVDVTADLDNNFDKIDATAAPVAPANVSTAAAAGSNLTFARTDHVHACGTISPAAITGSPAATLGATSTGALTPGSIVGSPASTLGATTTAALTASGTVTVGAHLLSSGGSTPTGGSTHANFTGPTIVGNDTRGTITLGTIGSPSAMGAQTTITHITFAVAYSSAPQVFLQASSGAAAVLDAITGVTTTGFDIQTGVAVTPLGFQAPAWSYLVVG